MITLLSPVSSEGLLAILLNPLIYVWWYKRSSWDKYHVIPKYTNWSNWSTSNDVTDFGNIKKGFHLIPFEYRRGGIIARAPPPPRTILFFVLKIL